MTGHAEPGKAAHDGARALMEDGEGGVVRFLKLVGLEMRSGCVTGATSRRTDVNREQFGGADGLVGCWQCSLLGSTYNVRSMFFRFQIDDDGG